MVDVTQQNGWHEWSRHVLAELERCDRNILALNSKLDQVRVDIAELKVKAGLWGLVGGLIPAVGAILIVLLEAGK